MADVKISALPAASALSGTELVPVVQGGITAQTTVSGILNGVPIGGTTPAAGAFTTLSATGNVTLGDATTDTLNVGNGGLVKDASGNVGIGTSSPGAKLHTVTASGYPAAFVGQYQAIRLQSSSDRFSISGVDATLSASYQPLQIQGSTLYFGIGATAAATLDSSGNLGIGVTPSAWGSFATYGIRAIDIGTYGAVENLNAYGGVNIVANAYNNGSNYIYKNSYSASKYTQGAGAHTWYTAPSGTAGTAITFTQSLAVGKGTTLALEGATSATGTGIAFPATQLASSDANTLDDYEEGVWTPTQGAGLTVVGTFSSSGTYTKVGRQVTVNGLLNGTTSVATSAGTIAFAGLPFLSAQASTGGAVNNATAGTSALLMSPAGSASVYSAGAIPATGSIAFSLTYFV